MFLAGGALKGGLVGVHPNLTDLVGGAQKFHTDFRRVYATVLDSWLGVVPGVAVATAEYLYTHPPEASIGASRPAVWHAVVVKEE